MKRLSDMYAGLASLGIPAPLVENLKRSIDAIDNHLKTLDERSATRTILAFTIGYAAGRFGLDWTRDEVRERLKDCEKQERSAS
jgi:hypothetical protein